MTKFLKFWSRGIVLLLLSVTVFASDDPGSKLDRILDRIRMENHLQESDPADDEVFLRRVWLNVAGRLPTPEEVKAYAKDPSPDKKAKLVDKVLASPGYADVMTMRFADMLRIKSEFPINLWPNAVQSWHHQIHADIAADRSWKDMAYSMLTESGSNFRVPHANFFRASADRTPAGLAKVTALTFLGIRTEKMSKSDLDNFAQFFSRIRFKKTDEWKEEIVYTDPHEAVVYARTPDGTRMKINCPEEDPREVFAQWLTKDGNPWFARAFVNRMWFWFFGKGIADPADDMIIARPSFFASLFGAKVKEGIDPELLDFLAEEFRRSGYSIRSLARLILNSKAYGASSAETMPEDEYRKAVSVFAVYPVRRLEAELIADILMQTIGLTEQFSSVIPEPFTYMPRGQKSVLIDDGSITSPILETLGKPSRDSGTLSERNSRMTESRKLFLLNSTKIYNRTSAFARNQWNRNRKKPENAYRRIYLVLLSREPSPEELNRIREWQKKRGPQEACSDLAWALVNSKEFLYYH